MFGRELGMTPAARQALKASGTNAAIDLAAYCATDIPDEVVDRANAIGGPRKREREQTDGERS
jgi:hypothetical protein